MTMGGRLPAVGRRNMYSAKWLLGKRFASLLGGGGDPLPGRSSGGCARPVFPGLSRRLRMRTRTDHHGDCTPRAGVSGWGVAPRKPLSSDSGGYRGPDKRLLWLTYGSGLVGAGLLLMIARREFHRYRNRRAGIEEYSDPAFGRRRKMIRYQGVTLPGTMEKTLGEIKSFPVRADDTWVVSWPRSGTTWVQEIVYLIQTDLDVDRERRQNLEQRFPFLEYVYPGLKTMNQSPSPRFIKSHLHYHLLPEQIRVVKPKIIYIARNPKDVLVSTYEFFQMLKPLKFEGPFEDFYQRFVDDKVYYSPWWQHVHQFWQLQQDHGNNILFLQYEDLQKDLKGCIKKISAFLGKTLTNDQLEAIAKHCHFYSMKNNDSSNYSWWDTYGIRDQKETEFLRKGIIGDWENYLTPKMSQRIEQLVEEKLCDTNLKFVYSKATKSSAEE